MTTDSVTSLHPMFIRRGIMCKHDFINIQHAHSGLLGLTARSSPDCPPPASCNGYSYAPSPRLRVSLAAIGGRAGGGAPPPPKMTGLGASCSLGPPTLTLVDSNKTYCFHELVLNLPASLDSQWPKCFQLQGRFAPLTRGSAPGPRWGLCPQTPVIGSCSALAMVPPQPLTPSAAYDNTALPYRDRSNNWQETRNHCKQIARQICRRCGQNAKNQRNTTILSSYEAGND